MAYAYLSKKDIASQYRAALSNLKVRRNDIASLHEGGFGKRLDIVLRDLDKAIERLKNEQQQAADKYGFRITTGIGPGDQESA